MNFLESAIQELKRLEDERSELLGKLAELNLKTKVLKESVNLLNSVYGWPDDLSTFELASDSVQSYGFGLTDRVRQVFEARPGQRLTPTQVRDLLALSGYTIHGGNPMASLHTILKRLTSRREIESIDLVDQGTLYCLESEGVGEVARSITKQMRPSAKSTARKKPS